MDFNLNEEQDILRKTARDFFSKEYPKSLVRKMAEDEKGYTLDLWRKLADLGWVGLTLPQQYGGSEGTFLDLVVLLEEMGRACFLGPFFSTVVLGESTILEGGSEQQKGELLPKLASGEMIATLAVTEPSGKYTADGIKARPTRLDDQYIIEGTKLFVPDANVADSLIVAANSSPGGSSEGSISLFLVNRNSPGVVITLLKTIDGSKQCEVILNKVSVPVNCVVGAADKGWPVVRKVLQRAAVAQCAEMVGAAQQVLEMTVAYAKQRVQFGRPIGSYQAIQHRCVDMLAKAESCRLITYDVGWMISQGLPCDKELAMCKAWCSEALRDITTIGHQVHGGIGCMEDHDLPLYFKRAKAWELSFGDGDFHREIIAQLLLQEA